MRKWLNRQTILILLTVLALVLAVPAVLAQDNDHGDAAAVDDHAVEDDHAEKSGGIGALGINTGFLIAQIINFLLVAGLLTVILWRPVINMMDSRAKKIEKGLEDAAAAANARMNAEAEAEKILAQARTEAGHVLENARKRGEDVAKSIEVEARADADKIRADARTAAQSERDAQLAGLRGQVAAISVAVAERLIGETLDEKRQQALINDFFAKVPADAKALGGTLEVVSAMPLDEAEQAHVKQELGAEDVKFVVNPSILGGLIVRAGDRVVDGSVSGNLHSLASKLQ